MSNKTTNKEEIVHITTDGSSLVRWCWSARDGRYLPIREERGSAYEARTIPVHEARLAIEATHKAEMAEIADLEATQAAASGRYGY